MPIAFLEKYKVMLSILAVIAVGGILLVSNIQTGVSDGEEHEQASNDATAEDAPKQVAQATNAGWETATSFDDMLGDEAEDDSLDNNGFGRSSPNDVSDEPDDFDNEGGFGESTAKVGPSPFASASSVPLSRSKTGKASERIVVPADGGGHAPIPVDASRISAAAGGKGTKSPSGEIE